MLHNEADNILTGLPGHWGVLLSPKVFFSLSLWHFCSKTWGAYMSLSKVLKVKLSFIKANKISSLIFKNSRVKLLINWK